MTDEPAKCLYLDSDGLYCVLPVGHVGDHDFNLICRTQDEAWEVAKSIFAAAEAASRPQRDIQCVHKTRHSFKSYNRHDTHTLQCCSPAGHDGAHQWKDVDTGRSVIWFNDGPPPDVDYSTRFRFFKDR